MFRDRDFPFFLILFCVILLLFFLFPRSTARNTVESLSLYSAPFSDPLSSSAASLSASIAEILKRAIIPKLNLNSSPSPQPNPNPNPALKSICNSTDYPDICVFRVSPMLSSGCGGGNPVSVLEASIKACIERARRRFKSLFFLCGFRGNDVVGRCFSFLCSGRVQGLLQGGVGYATEGVGFTSD